MLCTVAGKVLEGMKFQLPILCGLALGRKLLSEKSGLILLLVRPDRMWRARGLVRDVASPREHYQGLWRCRVQPRDSGGNS